MTLGDKYEDERRRASRFMEEATIVAKQAKAQGDPTDGKTLGHMLTHGRNSQILVPGMNTGGGSVLAGIDYKVEAGKDLRNVMLRGDMQVVPDFTVKPARPAKKRPKRRR
jgi:hypothetical protein